MSTSIGVPSVASREEAKGAKGEREEALLSAARSARSATSSGGSVVWMWMQFVAWQRRQHAETPPTLPLQMNLCAAPLTQHHAWYLQHHAWYFQHVHAHCQRVSCLDLSFWVFHERRMCLRIPVNALLCEHQRPGHMLRIGTEQGATDQSSGTGRPLYA